jgi:hypothetical protein
MDNKLNILSFTEVQGGRPELETPFNFGGYTVATCGAVILFSPRDSNYKPGNHKFCKNLDVLISDFNEIKEHEFFDVSAPFEHKEISQMMTCHECNGGGSVNLESEYSEYECECKTCEGKGEISNKIKVIEIQGVKIRPYFYDLVNVENTKLAVSQNRIAFKNGSQFGFIVGIRVGGVIMTKELVRWFIIV